MKEPYNGLPPFVSGVDTSEDAARSIAPDAGQLQEFVYDVIKGTRAGGMTCDEIEVETGLKHQTASARIRELQQKKRIVDSSRRRATRSGRGAIVWVATEFTTPPEGEVPASVEPGPGQSLLFPKTVIDPAGEDGLTSLRNRCLSCTRCELAKTRTQAVFGEGNPDCPDICFVGEAPGANEDEQGHPFVGKAGQMLTRILSKMGYTREQIYICNAVACRPPGNRPPEKHELQACHEFLIGQVRAVRPKVLVALGASAVSAMLGSKKKVGELRGKWLEWEGVPLMPTFHPSYLCRVEHQTDGVEMMKLAWADMQMVLTKLGRDSTSR